jgi:hypothetical protein
MRGKHGRIALVFVAFLLAGCGQATAARIPRAAIASTPSPTAASQACSARPGEPSAHRLGDLLVSARLGINAPSRKLPAGTPLKPLRIPNPNDLAALDAQIPVSPPVNRGAEGKDEFLVDVCNASTTRSHLVEGGTLKITSFTPVAGRVSRWNICDGFFTRSVPSGVTGQCGGTNVADEVLSLTFPPGAGVGFAQAAVLVGTSPIGPGPLPVTLAPGKLIVLLLSITVPHAQGFYGFAFSLMADHTQLAFIPALSPTLFPRRSHTFTGAACLTPVMQHQIPRQVTPALFFICPEGVFVMPTTVPGKG